MFAFKYCAACCWQGGLFAPARARVASKIAVPAPPQSGGHKWGDLDPLKSATVPGASPGRRSSPCHAISIAQHSKIWSL